MPRRVAFQTVGMLLAVVLGAILPVWAAGSARSAVPEASPQARTEAGAGAPLDLNTATAAQLRALPGMGDVYVRRILEGRPFTAKNQLLTRGILPPEAYGAIRERVVARRPPRLP